MKKPYCSLSRDELLALKEELEQEYKKIQEKGLKLDMSRGKPSKAQLDLTMGMLDVVNSKSDLDCESGVDCRNYGVLLGIPEIRRLMGDMVGVPAENVIIYGSSSLNIMFDTIARGIMHGFGGNTPWLKQEKIKFLCPVPGYDRHFAITETFGFEMINIPLGEDGPDMDMVEQYVNNDPTVKGIWCVPIYGNPTGIVYSDETVKRMANLKPAAPDFRIFWDNAYGVHHLYQDDQPQVLEILAECKKAGNPDMVYGFMSTSKITFPGAGIAAMYTSEKNIEEVKSILTYQTIGYDKINQLRHARFFGNIENLKAHMMKHADIIRPKFEAVLDILDEGIGGLEIGTYSRPKGGYFISFNAMEGCAKQIVSLMKEAGIVMTGAGATYPYGKDPKDSNIRIAPTLPPVEEIREAAGVFVLCVKLASVNKLLNA